MNAFQKFEDEIQGILKNGASVELENHFLLLK
jgi:hypothetical protein